MSAQEEFEKWWLDTRPQDVCLPGDFDIWLAGRKSGMTESIKLCYGEAEGSYGMQQCSVASDREGFGREIRAAKACAAAIERRRDEEKP